jgi:hypothetical protein
MKCSKKPEATKNKPTTTDAVKTVRVVMEMVLTLPVGPESHINCMRHPLKKPIAGQGSSFYAHTLRAQPTKVGKKEYKELRWALD